ncbi:MAG: uracil-DNA glycosylase family protein [Bacteroidales bacterium]|nr:uracil-DNA glycosylase family protein [Bacteroidales bacterium]
MTIETHPLVPFLPENATILFLGSFPPPRARWSMDFFYPNWINDFWRIQGLIHFGDKTYFEKKDGSKAFDKDRIVAFCIEKGYAFFDTATKVLRKKDNASDNFLEILEPTDVSSLLARLPHCKTVVTTGGKASEELASIIGVDSVPGPTEMMEVSIAGRRIRWFRMPSSSRAYPLPLEKKKEAYMQLL